jgi:hypothetical protein
LPILRPYVIQRNDGAARRPVPNRSPGATPNGSPH